jgi:hypothetical protein
MSFFEFDNNFQVPESFNLEILDQLPIHKHRYGEPMEAEPTHLYWTEYQPYQEGDGTISFARKLYLQYPEVVDYIVQYINQFFPKLPLDRHRVNLLKTCGSIRRHMDESFRKSCINIGIKNSTGAMTRVSTTRDHFMYDSVATTEQCLDGHAYLLDTSCLHQVIAVNTEPRYLFTYGFGQDFHIVKSLYVPKS